MPNWHTINGAGIAPPGGATQTRVRPFVRDERMAVKAADSVQIPDLDQNRRLATAYAVAMEWKPNLAEVKRELRGSAATPVGRRTGGCWLGTTATRLVARVAVSKCGE
jgi:hypothetical protein